MGCNDVKHVIYHLYNLEDYKEWNNSLEINKKKSNLFSYDYFEKDSQKYEISNLKRNFLCNQEQSKFLIVGNGNLIKNTSMRIIFIRF